MNLAGKYAVLASAAVLGLATGCGSPAYQLKEKPTTPITRPEVKTASNGVEFQVNALIAYESPGAWKRRAYWDEYLVTFSNHGATAATIAGVVLGDVLDREIGTGDDPWTLEKAGRKHEQYLKSLGAPADASFSAMTRSKRALAATAGTGGLAVIYGGVGSAAVGPALIYAAPFVLLAAMPVVAVNRLMIDPANKDLILGEFNRRRLKLPFVLAPGATVAGSLFFPLTPGPENLAVRISVAAGNSTLRVGLPGLEELHFTHTPDKTALKAAKPKRFFIKPVPEKKSPREDRVTKS